MQPEVRISNPNNGNDKKVAWFVRKHLDRVPRKFLDQQDIDMMRWNQERGLALECVDTDKHNKLLGVATLSLIREDGNYIELGELVVLEKFRKQSIGRKLVETAVQLSKEQGGGQ